MDTHVDVETAKKVLENATIAASALRANQLAASQQIDAAMDDLLNKLLDTVERRRRELHAQVEKSIAVDVAAVHAQIADVKECQAKQIATRTRVRELAALPDVDLITLASELKSMNIMELVPPLPVVPPVQKVARPEIPFDLDTRAIDVLCATTLQSIGSVQKAHAAGVPVLHGYSDDSPTYVAGTTVPPNRPRYDCDSPVVFRMEPDVPMGLELDAATGVVSGTPVWDSSAPRTDTGVAMLHRVVVAATAAGVARAGLHMTLLEHDA